MSSYTLSEMGITIKFLLTSACFLLWYRWVDNHLVHMLSPNIYRNTSEALESFDYITSNGKLVTRSHLMHPDFVALLRQSSLPSSVCVLIITLQVSSVALEH